MAAAVSLQKAHAQLAVVQQQEKVNALQGRISVLSSNIDRLTQERAVARQAVDAAAVIKSAAYRSKKTFIDAHSAKRYGCTYLKKLKDEEQQQLNQLNGNFIQAVKAWRKFVDQQANIVIALGDAVRTSDAETPTAVSALNIERARLEVLRNQLALFK